MADPDFMPFRPNSSIHVMGIGGAGMSAMAHLLLDQGYLISGCDREETPATSALKRRGVKVFLGHSGSHLAGAGALLRSSAVPVDSAEVRAASQRGLPVLTRHDLWRAFSRQREVVAVSGTHGKTTISSLLTHIYRCVGKPHGYLLGAPLGKEPSGRWGSGDLIVEADEYDRTFLALTPRVAVISNVDYDHLDIYPTQADYDAAFRTFTQRLPENGGEVIACGDDPGVRRVLRQGTYLSYGLSEGNDCQAINLRRGAAGMTFTLIMGFCQVKLLR